MDQKTNIYRSHCHGLWPEWPVVERAKTDSTQTSKASRPSTAIIRRHQSQQGFGAIFLLALLPVILAMMIGILLLVTTQQALLGPRQICRREIIAFESQSGEQLQTLEALNLQVKALRMEELKLKAELAVALATENWPAAALIKSKLSIISESYRKIVIEQKLVLERNKVSTENLRANLQNQITVPFKALADQLKSFARLSVTQHFSEIKQLAVHPDNSGSIAPVYELDEPFIQRQSSQAFWRIEVRIQNSSWASKWFRAKYSWQDSCGGSLQKERSKWQATLIQTTTAKFSSKR